MARLIDADAIKYRERKECGGHGLYFFWKTVTKEEIDEMPTVDAVEVDVLKAWLYEIAMNNSDNYLGDACEVIIGRLNGLREFARERREGE